MSYNVVMTYYSLRQNRVLKLIRMYFDADTCVSSFSWYNIQFIDVILNNSQNPSVYIHTKNKISLSNCI